MTEIIFLGVGGAFATEPAYDHTALLVRDGSATILLDAGPGIMQQLELAGVTAGDLTHVIASHQHGDHALGFPMVLLNRVLIWPERPLQVLAMPPVLAILQELTRLVYPDVARRAEDMVSYVPLKAGTGPHPLPGAEGIGYAVAPGQHSVATWGVRLDFASGHSLLYSSDTGPSAPMTRLASNVDLLVHEAYYAEPPAGGNPNHSAASQVGALAARAGVRQLALVHRGDTGLAAAADYRTAAAKHFAGPILLPAAGDRIPLTP